MTQMTHDEIVSNTKLLMQGLEALRVEHASMVATEESSGTAPPSDADRTSLLRKNLDSLDLGLG